MAKSALIQGENHLNSRDIEKLINNNSQSDILYLEGRTNEDVISFWPVDYFLFLIGGFTLYIAYETKREVSTLANNYFNMEKEAQKRGIDTYSTIDLELPTIYEHISILGRILSLVATLAVMVACLALLFLPSIGSTIIGLIGLFLVPFIHFTIIVTLILPEEIRDKAMGEAVLQHAEEHSHDDVLVLVGDRHVQGVASRLEKEGWNVTAQQSNDSVMRIQRRLRSLLSSVDHWFRR